MTPPPPNHAAPTFATVGADHTGTHDHPQGDLFALLEKLHAEDVEGLRKRLASAASKSGSEATHATAPAVTGPQAGAANGIVTPPIPPVGTSTPLDENWIHRVLGMVKEYVVFVGVTCLHAFWAMVYYPNILADRISLVIVTVGLLVVMTAFLPWCIFAMMPVAVDAFNWISEQLFDGLGLVNASYPHIFHDLDEKRRKAAREFLSQSMNESPGSAQERVFNLDAAKLLLQCSALMYERDTHPPTIAKQPPATAAPTTLNGTTPHCNTSTGPVPARTITNIAREELQLEFHAVSELNSVGAAFCGLFWDPQENFVIVAFRGTNPTDYREWTTDFTVAMVDAGKWLGEFGRVHSGFMEKIFPTEVAPRSLMPYETINNAIKEVADRLRQTRDDPIVNVWVTGHSLGCALGSVMYSRMVCEPHELGLGTMVRDAYLFAAPIVCDARSAATFNNKINRYFHNKPRTMWRVTNGMDIVATGLPNAGDNVEWVRSSYNMMGFAHLGCEIRLRPYPHPCIVRSDGGHITPGTQVTIQSSLTSDPVSVDFGTIQARLRSPVYHAMRAMQNVPLVGRVIAHGTGFYWNAVMVVGGGKCVWERGERRVGV